MPCSLKRESWHSKTYGLTKLRKFLTMEDSYLTIKQPASGEFKDRGSRFIGYAFPVKSEEDISANIEALKKEHFKARHHCFAWRLGTDGQRFRANDDGEPSGTAGRPILGQIDSLELTDVLVVVVRYFGGTLLGTSGLIQAYREAAATSLSHAEIKEVVVQKEFLIDCDYALMPEVIHALKTRDIEIFNQDFGEKALIRIGIRLSQIDEKLLTLKAAIWKVSEEEAKTLDWPPGIDLQDE